MPDSRYIKIELLKRNVSCLAELCDREAPDTCRVVWDALPLEGDAWHAKYAMNEVYALIPPPPESGPGLENPTMMPIPGDVVFFYFDKGHLARSFREEHGFADLPGVVDLAVFYGRNNYLFNPATGPIPGNIFARIVENFDEMATACNDVWRSGSIGERLRFSRVESRA
jgi:hypothetical protein